MQFDNQDTEVVAFGLSLYENSLVDKFNPDGAQPAPCDVPLMEVNSSIDAIDNAWNSDPESAFSSDSCVDTSVSMCMFQVMTWHFEGSNHVLRQLGWRRRVGIPAPYSRL